MILKSKKKSCIDHELLQKDILKKLRLLKKNQRYLDEIGLSRSTIVRLQRNKEMKVSKLLRILDWLETDINKYIIKKPTELKKPLS